MPNAERRPRRRPGENRERLLQAGISAFGLYGYQGASTSDIAARAGVPQPHVYTNFRTKQELFLACVSRAAELLGEAGPDGDGDGDEQAARLMLQAVAALGTEGSLGGELGERLTVLRASIGEQAFESLLLRGARGLLPAVPAPSGRR